MSREERAALNREAAKFVKKVVTEVYGQRISRRALSTTARRVVDALPTEAMHASKAGAAKDRGRR
jgi:hypothetical protein